MLRLFPAPRNGITQFTKGLYARALLIVIVPPA